LRERIDDEQGLDGAAGEKRFVTNSSDLPIAVDLDGTLLRADTLHEGLVDIFSRRPCCFSSSSSTSSWEGSVQAVCYRYARIDTNGIPVNSGSSISFAKNTDVAAGLACSPPLISQSSRCSRAFWDFRSGRWQRR
jgi:hypothetical protein